MYANHFGADILPRLFVRNQIIYFALDYGQSHGADNVGPRTENFVCVCMQILLNTLVQIFHLQPREHYPSCVGGFIYNLLNTMFHLQLLVPIHNLGNTTSSTTAWRLPPLCGGPHLQPPTLPPPVCGVTPVFFKHHHRQKESCFVMASPSKSMESCFAFVLGI